MVFVLGSMSLVISQFTGLYYTFDESNRYQRSPVFFLWYAFPAAMTMVLLTVVWEYRSSINKRIRTSLFLFIIVPYIAAILQILIYGLSFINITLVGLAILLYIYAFLDLNDTALRANTLEIELLKKQQKKINTLFGQTAEALANAIDAKDKYTHGHSTRVAEYSMKIAKIAGKNDEECEEIYFAALLHDVGKIGINDQIITKEGTLTKEEFDEIKKHPVIGSQILSSISQSPYLSIGANYHHERYDGKGYPSGLKGEDIPEIARIIAVADAYDAMTSKRSYREPIAQMQVREELVKGIGTQFDPKFGEIMLGLMDGDVEYRLKENEEVKELAGKRELRFEEYESSFSEGILVEKNIVRIRLRSIADKEHPGDNHIPSLILFDSLDARAHFSDNKAKDMYYTEYGRIDFAGRTTTEEARDIKTTFKDTASTSSGWDKEAREGVTYYLEAVRFKDHALIRIMNRFRTIEHIIALPDSSRFFYIAITGEYCKIDNVEIGRDEKEVDANYIPRIAEEISYIKGPAGDVPNVQVDGWKTDGTLGVPVTDMMTITFHTMSLPTARLVWHCAYICLYSADDGLLNGENYQDLITVRLDGENWHSRESADNSVVVTKNDEFISWENWKEKNKQGMDVTVIIRKVGNEYTIITENAGIAIKSVTNAKNKSKQVYVSLSGDQCAITNVRIKKT
ncbi:MAG: HD-GYP domain-containing protein [Butyrivibrio sp.]|nr:HD-GYP domain-containing protein [Butyrivibrio sp.]